MPSSRTLAAALVAALGLTLVAGASAAVGPDLTRSLRTGGLVVVFRHAATDFSKPDRDPVVVSDCSTQRNLSAQGTRGRACDRPRRQAARAAGREGVRECVLHARDGSAPFGRATVHRLVVVRR